MPSWHRTYTFSEVFPGKNSDLHLFLWALQAVPPQKRELLQTKAIIRCRYTSWKWFSWLPVSSWSLMSQNPSWPHTWVIKSPVFFQSNAHLAYPKVCFLFLLLLWFGACFLFLFVFPSMKLSFRPCTVSFLTRSTLSCGHVCPILTGSFACCLHLPALRIATSILTICFLQISLISYRQR